MSTDGNGRFYVSTAYTGATLPATVQVLASDSSKPTLPNDQPNVALRDLVVISRADATCSLATRLCTLVVDAQSSDSIVPPTLTLAHTATALVNGSVTVTNAAALPGSVTVISSAGGSASKPVTVVNQ
jgi:hypothetical protein